MRIFRIGAMLGHRWVDLTWMSMDRGFRIRICRIIEDLQDWGDAGASFSPSPLIPLPSRERGYMVDLACCRPTLWIDESPITLCQRVRLQRKGVNALSFSSR